MKSRTQAFLLIDHGRVMLDAYSRRHEAQKIYLRQGAAQRWIGWRDQVLQGERPHTGHTEQLAACDAQLRVVSSQSEFYPPTYFLGCKSFWQEILVLSYKTPRACRFNVSRAPRYSWRPSSRESPASWTQLHRKCPTDIAEGH